MFPGLNAQYQWSCSPLLDTIGDRYHLPDLGDGDDGSVAFIAHASGLQLSSVGSSHIYPIPSTLNCSGTVTAVEYCYRAVNSQLGTEQLVFTLLTLQQSGLDFNITDVIPISSTPTSDTCTQSLFSVQYCCDILSLDMLDSFLLPAENFAFGVQISSSVNLLGYNGGSFPQFIVEQFRYSQANFGAPAMGGRITLSESNRVSDRTLRLLQFLISKYT